MHLVLFAVAVAAALATESVDAEGREVRAVRSGGAEPPPGSAAVVQAEGLVRKRSDPDRWLAATPIGWRMRSRSLEASAGAEPAAAPAAEPASRWSWPRVRAAAATGGAADAGAATGGVEPGAEKAAEPQGDAAPEAEDAKVVPELQPQTTWGILISQPYLLCLLCLGTLVVACVFCISMTSDDDPLKGVMATVPLTPLELLPHREYQIVRTRGLVTLTGESSNSTLASTSGTLLGEATPRAAEKKSQLFNSPLTSELCVYSRTVVEQHTATGWEQLLDFVEARPFSLAERGKADPLILCEVSASSPAVLDLPAMAVFDGDLVQLPPPVQARIRALPGPKLPAYSMFRVSEWALTEGQELEAMGLVLRRVSRRETRTALGVGGLSATNADYIASLFSPMRVGRWRTVGNKVVLGLPSFEEEEKK